MDVQTMAIVAKVYVFVTLDGKDKIALKSFHVFLPIVVVVGSACWAPATATKVGKVPTAV